YQWTGGGTGGGTLLKDDLARRGAGYLDDHQHDRGGVGRHADSGGATPDERRPGCSVRRVCNDLYRCGRLAIVLRNRDVDDSFTESSLSLTTAAVSAVRLLSMRSTASAIR